MRLGPGLLDAILENCSPAQQKQKLYGRIRVLIRDPNTSGWLIGFACDLMLVHGAQGRPGASVLFGKMETLLQDMQALRECEQREGKPPAPLGRWLNSAVHKICAAHAIPTPRDRKAAGAYA